jgi:hypothetical protein
LCSNSLTINFSLEALPPSDSAQKTGLIRQDEWMPVSDTLNLRFVYSVDSVNTALALPFALFRALLPCQRESRKIYCEFKANLVCIISQYS